MPAKHAALSNAGIAAPRCCHSQVQAHSGTLSSKEIEMLRHSFTLMAAGDGPKNGLLPHQLRELIVMAGLDPAMPSTRQLVDRLLAQREDGPNGQRISFDSFLKVVVNFQEEATQVQAYEGEQQQQQQQQQQQWDGTQEGFSAHAGSQSMGSEGDAQIPAHWDGQQEQGQEQEEEQYLQAQGQSEQGYADEGEAQEDGARVESGSDADADGGADGIGAEAEQAQAEAEAEQATAEAEEAGVEAQEAEAEETEAEGQPEGEAQWTAEEEQQEGAAAMPDSGPPAVDELAAQGSEEGAGSALGEASHASVASDAAPAAPAQDDTD